MNITFLKRRANEGKTNMQFQWGPSPVKNDIHIQEMVNIYASHKMGANNPASQSSLTS